jgi:hypothetical protein
MLLRLDADGLETGVSDRVLLLGVAAPYPLVRSREGSKAGSCGGDDICIARTDSGLRKRGRSGRDRAAASLAGKAGLEAMDDSEGMAEMKLYCEERRGSRAECEDPIDFRDVYELR